MKLEGSALFRAVKLGFVEVRQVALLAAIVDRPGLSVRDYADRVGVAKPSVTRAMTALQSQGLIHRKQAENDRRLCILTPTGLGKQMIGEMFLEETQCSNGASAAV